MPTVAVFAGQVVFRGTVTCEADRASSNAKYADLPGAKPGLKFTVPDVPSELVFEKETLGPS